jgi:hypothetical protein
MPATSTAGRKRRSSARKKRKNGWILWWPLLLGVVATPFALHAASILALEGPAGLRLLYPFVLLVKDPVFGLSNDLANTVSQGMMYAQFPLYGLLMAVVLRWRNVALALGTVLVVHALGILALLLRAHLLAR